MKQLRLIQPGVPRKEWKVMCQGTYKEIRQFCTKHNLRFDGESFYKSTLGDLYCIF